MEQFVVEAVRSRSHTDSNPSPTVTDSPPRSVLRTPVVERRRLTDAENANLRTPLLIGCEEIPDPGERPLRSIHSVGPQLRPGSPGGSARERLARTLTRPRGFSFLSPSNLQKTWGDSEERPKRKVEPARHQRKFAVVEVSNGQLRRHEIQTPELLRMVHIHNKTATLQDRIPGSLKLRDLRQVCSSTSVGGQRASLEPRRNAVVVNFPPLVRCIIMHDRVCYILRSTIGRETTFAPDARLEPGSGKLETAVAKIESQLLDKLQQLSAIKTSMPFEFAVLEAILVEVCNYLSHEAMPLKENADIILAQIETKRAAITSLQDITDLKKELDTVMDRIKGAQKAIHEILEMEEDMRRLECSRFWEHPEDWDNPSDSANAEDLEMLLECYEQEVESLLSMVKRIDDRLDDALQIMELQLATVRNTFLKAELGLDIVGTLVTVVGVIAGIFGMNLPNGYETNDKIFWPFAHTSGMLCILSGFVVYYAFRRLRL